jgi:hypothetical protein
MILGATPGVDLNRHGGLPFTKVELNKNKMFNTKYIILVYVVNGAFTKMHSMKVKALGEIVGWAFGPSLVTSLYRLYALPSRRATGAVKTKSCWVK